MKHSSGLFLLLLFFITAVVLRSLLVDTSYFFWDEAIYLMHGKLFAGQAAAYSETFLRPPLLPLVISPLAHLSPGHYELASRLLLAFLNSLVVFPVFFFTKAVFSRKADVGCRVDTLQIGIDRLHIPHSGIVPERQSTSPYGECEGGSEATAPSSVGLIRAQIGRIPICALIAAVIAAVLPVHILNSRWVMADALGALLAFSSVAAYVLGLRHGILSKRRSIKKWLIYLGGVLAGLAILMKFTNLLLLVLLLPVLLMNLKRRFAAIATSILLFAAVLLPYLAFNAVSFGSPFYAFGRAFQAVAEPSPVSFGFFLWLLWDSFGVLLAFLAVGIAVSASWLLLRKQRSGVSNSNDSTLFFLFYCLTVTLSYFFFIIQKGVVKPAGIEWEAERFLLLFALFAIPFIGFGVVRSAAFVRQALPLKLTAAVAVVVATAVFLSFYPQFARAYTPAAVYEEGLRDVAKAAGIYLHSSSIAEFGCLGNCPPVAYYSGKKMGIYFSGDALAAALADANSSYIVVFDSHKADFLGSYSVEDEFCSKRHCAYLLSRR